MGKHSGGPAVTLVPRPIYRGSRKSKNSTCFSIAVTAMMFVLMILVIAV